MVLALEQRLGGDLVSIETEEEWNFINDEIQRRNTTNYDNRWSWVSGRTLTICKWGKGEPRGEYEGAFHIQAVQ